MDYDEYLKQLNKLDQLKVDLRLKGEFDKADAVMRIRQEIERPKSYFVWDGKLCRSDE